MNDIIEIVQALEDSNILLKGVTKTIINKIKEQKGEFLIMLLGALACLLENKLAGKEIVRAGSRKGIVRAGMETKWIFNATSSFNKLRNAKILSKRT